MTCIEKYFGIDKINKNVIMIDLGDNRVVLDIDTINIYLTQINSEECIKLS